MASTPEQRSHTFLQRAVLPPGALWLLRLVMAGVFVGGGIMKLTGSAAMIQLFSQIGVGQWLRYFVGTAELVGGATLLVPGWGALVSLALIGMMLGAAMAELLIIRRPPLAAVACAVALMIIVWSSREEVPSLLRRHRRE